MLKFEDVVEAIDACPLADFTGVRSEVVRAVSYKEDVLVVNVRNKFVTMDVGAGSKGSVWIGW
jgi:hypothetical protein